MSFLVRQSGMSLTAYTYLQGVISHSVVTFLVENAIQEIYYVGDRGAIDIFDIA